jgi:hypothetical protein
MHPGMLDGLSLTRGPEYIVFAMLPSGSSVVPAVLGSSTCAKG